MKFNYYALQYKCNYTLLIFFLLLKARVLFVDLIMCCILTGRLVKDLLRL